MLDGSEDRVFPLVLTDARTNVANKLESLVLGLVLLWYVAKLLPDLLSQLDELDLVFSALLHQVGVEGGLPWMKSFATTCFRQIRNYVQRRDEPSGPW